MAEALDLSHGRLFPICWKQWEATKTVQSGKWADGLNFCLYLGISCSLLCEYFHKIEITFAYLCTRSTACHLTYFYSFHNWYSSLKSKIDSIMSNTVVCFSKMSTSSNMCLSHHSFLKDLWWKISFSDSLLYSAKNNVSLN